MKTNVIVSSTLIAFLLANPLMIATASARDFSYLAGRDNRQASTQLEQAGYSQVHYETSGDNKWDYWWNASSQDCISAHQVGYTYQSLTNSPSSDCTKYVSQESGNNGTNTALAVGVGVAAVAGLAALIHHNRHKHDNDNNDDNGRTNNYVDVADLQGIRASYGESELHSRGFHAIDGEKSWHRSYTTWWNPSARECVQVTTRQGRYDEVNVVSNSACS